MLLICNVKKMFNISMLCDLNIKFICFMFIQYIFVVRVQKNFQKCDFLQILLNYNRLYDIFFLKIVYDVDDIKYEIYMNIFKLLC